MIKQILTFVKKYWIWFIVVFLLLSFQVWNWFKVKPQTKLSEAEALLKTQPPSSKNLQKIAMEVAHHLGTAYDWWHIRSFTENDKEVYLLLKDLSKAEFKAVSLLYFEIYAKGKNLDLDLARLLDKEFYIKLNF